MPDQSTLEQTRRLASLLAVDINGYTIMTDQDEAAAIRITHAVRAELKAIAMPMGGREFHTAGDAFLFEFSSAQACFEAAERISADLAGRLDITPFERLEVSIGLHLGDINPQEDGDVLGQTVNMVARLQQKAPTGKVYASETFVSSLPTSLRGRFGALGKQQLKNIKTPVEVYELGAPAAAAGRQSKSLFAIGAAAALALVAGGVFFLGNGSLGSDATTVTTPAPVSVIDRRAISVATEPLVFANKPLEDAISSLIETQDFTKAREQLLKELNDQRELLSSYQQVDLLHQAAALAFDRNVTEAQRLYRQILAINDKDWLALWQLSKIYLLRSEREEAKALIARAKTAVGLTQTQRLRLEIDEVRMTNTDYSVAANDFEQIRATAVDLGYEPVETLADIYRLSYTRLNYTSPEGEETDLTRDALLDQIEQLHRLEAKVLARSDYTQLGLIYNLLFNRYESTGQNQKAEEYVSKVLELALALEQASGIITNLSMFAWFELDRDALERAYIAKLLAEQVLREADLVYLAEGAKLVDQALKDKLGDERLECVDIDREYVAMKSELPGLSKLSTPVFNCAK